MVKLVDCLIELNSFVVVVLINNIFVIAIRNFLNSCFTFLAVAGRMLAPIVAPSTRRCLSFKVLLSSLVNLFASILCSDPLVDSYPTLIRGLIPD